MQPGPIYSTPLRQRVIFGLLVFILLLLAGLSSARADHPRFQGASAEVATTF